MALRFVLSSDVPVVGAAVVTVGKMWLIPRDFWLSTAT